MCTKFIGYTRTYNTMLWWQTYRHILYCRITTLCLLFIFSKCVSCFVATPLTRLTIVRCQISAERFSRGDTCPGSSCPGEQPTFLLALHRTRSSVNQMTLVRVGIMLSFHPVDDSYRAPSKCSDTRSVSNACSRASSTVLFPCLQDIGEFQA